MHVSVTFLHFQRRQGTLMLSCVGPLHMVGLVPLACLLQTVGPACLPNASTVAQLWLFYLHK